MTTKAGEKQAKDIGSGVAPVTAQAAAATASNPPAGGSGIQGGCYDTASNRNLAIASLAAQITDMAAIRVQLQAIGYVAGSTTVVGRTRARDLGSGKVPVNVVSVTATALAPPSGGTGQTAGGYDTDTNRDLFITRLTALIADIASMRVELQAVGIISGAVSAVGKARMRDIGTGRTPSRSVAIAATAVAAPAGGTGANAGGWSSAGNRNLAITSLAAARTDVAALRTELVALNIVGA